MATEIEVFAITMMSAWLLYAAGIVLLMFIWSYIDGSYHYVVSYETVISFIVLAGLGYICKEYPKTVYQIAYTVQKLTQNLPTAEICYAMISVILVTALRELFFAKNGNGGR